MTSRLAVALAFLTLAVMAPTGAALPAQPSFAGCLSSPVIRPHSILMACGDGGFFVTDLVWTRWNAVEARGTGVGHTNTCTPLCASGNFVRSTVSVRLWRPATCTGQRREFTRITWRYVANKPPTFPVTGTEKSPFYLGRGCM